MSESDNPRVIVLAYDNNRQWLNEVEDNLALLANQLIPGQKLGVITANYQTRALTVLGDIRPHALITNPQLFSVLARQYKEFLSPQLSTVVVADPLERGNNHREFDRSYQYPFKAEDDIEKIRHLEQFEAAAFLRRPFELDRLAFDILVNAKARQTPLPPTLQLGDVLVNLAKSFLVHKDSIKFKLTQTEAKLLSEFIRGQGRLMKPAEILVKTWGPAYEDEILYLRVCIDRLRSKLEPNPNQPQLIKNEIGVGYYLTPN